MLWTWFKNYRAEKRTIQNIADDLIAKHGVDVHNKISELSRHPDLTNEERSRVYKIRAIIEKRLGVKPRADTATRYGEPNQ